MWYRIRNQNEEILKKNYETWNMGIATKEVVEEPEKSRCNSKELWM